jgi:alanine racemase
MNITSTIIQDGYAVLLLCTHFANPESKNKKSIRKKLKQGEERNMKVKTPSIFLSC